MLNIYYKHSFRCPISLLAKKEVRSFLENNTIRVNFEEIDVINNKERSKEIQELFNIEHKSPQIIICDENDKVIWDASHQEIKEQNILNSINS